MYRDSCDSDPCHHDLFGDMLYGEGTILDPAAALILPNTWNMLYRSYFHDIHSFLGAGNRICVPLCVHSLIRDIFPDLDGAYMGR